MAQESTRLWDVSGIERYIIHNDGYHNEEISSHVYLLYFTQVVTIKMTPVH